MSIFNPHPAHFHDECMSYFILWSDDVEDFELQVKITESRYDGVVQSIEVYEVLREDNPFDVTREDIEEIEQELIGEYYRHLR